MGFFGNSKKKNAGSERVPQVQFQNSAPTSPTPSTPPHSPPRSPMAQPLTVEMGASEDAEIVGWTSQDPDRVRAQIAATMAARQAATSSAVGSRSALEAASRGINASSQAPNPDRTSAATENEPSPRPLADIKTPRTSSRPRVANVTSSVTYDSPTKTRRTSSRPAVGNVTSSVTYDSPTRLGASSSAFFSAARTDTTFETDGEDSFDYRGGAMGSGTFDSAETPASGIGTYYTEEESMAAEHIARHHKQMSNPEPLVMANLMQWKAAAEDGPIILRFLLVIAAIGMLVTSVIPFITDPDFLTFRHGILAAYTFIFSIIIIIMDGRVSSLGRNPVGARARLRKVITKHFNVLRLLWGRGLLAVFAGTLHIAQMLQMTFISGGIVAGLGVIAWLLGCMASYNLSNLKASLTDDSFLEYLFEKHDKDGDGYINAYEFSLFLVDIGLEFDDVYTLKAFNGIPKKRDKRVSFREFRVWWSQCKFDDSHDKKRMRGVL